VNVTKIYYKHFCKCHSVPPVQPLYANKNFLKREKNLKSQTPQMSSNLKRVGRCTGAGAGDGAQ
jgi:hypothetical protein